ncbi:MAG: peptidase S10 [Planctomycetota bacterium]|nr:MAG: peptidase S10 [Planctomycetota bacterium]
MRITSLLAFAILSLAHSQTPESKPADPFAEAQVETQHTLTIGGRAHAYTATAGTLQLKEEDGKGRASLFYVAYVAEPKGEPRERPITFCFNGGPGSSSVWLHMGLFGPRRVRVDAGAIPPPPCDVVDNEHSLLDRSDFVFIDPVSTGFSRALPGKNASEFHGVQSDVAAVGEFIRLYCTRNERWASPKFLAGESYGTTRAAALCAHLQRELGMYVNGIVLVSMVLDFRTIRWDAGNDLPAQLYLPSYAATAWYHKRLSSELLAQPLADVVRQAGAFADGAYARALQQGDAQPAAERAAIERELARWTGLTGEYVASADLRVENRRYQKQLLRAQRRVVGRLDSRFLGIDEDSAGEEFELDPSYSAIEGPYSAALNDYARRELGWKSDLAYEILTGRVHPWDYDAENRYLNVAESLRQELCRNEHLRVFVAAGWYDLATPVAAARHTLDHLGLEPEQRARVEMATYEAGHMMYTHEPSLAKLAGDLRAFYSKALAR